MASTGAVPGGSRPGARLALAGVACAAALLALPPTALGVPPANDNFANADVPSAFPVTGTNVDATKEAGEPNHAGDAGGHSVWYRVTAASSGVLSVSTCGSDFDTLLGIYTGTSVNALTQVASNDDSCGAQSEVTFPVTAGTDYYAAIDGFSDATGNVTVNLAVAGPATTFKGTTDQGRGITVEVGDDGLVSKVKYKFKARCHPGFVRGTTVANSPLDESTPTAFTDGDSNKDRFRGILFRFKGEVIGEKISDTEWTGTFKEKVRISARGRTFARCKTGEIGWSATFVP